MFILVSGRLRHLVKPLAKDARMTIFIVLMMAVWALMAIIAFVKKDK